MYRGNNWPVIKVVLKQENELNGETLLNERKWIP